MTSDRIKEIKDARLQAFKEVEKVLTDYQGTEYAIVLLDNHIPDFNELTKGGIRNEKYKCIQMC